MPDMCTATKLDQPWQRCLASEFNLPYMQGLRAFLKSELQAGKTIYPKPHQYFSALNLTAFDQVKVVILGQDPYHGEGQAHGLCFSVPPEMRTPPSLINIYKELKHDLDLDIPNHGCFVPWAKQGVLLLNSVLTVEQGKAASHQQQGWERFTDAVIMAINEQKDHVVFILWGSYAQKKGALIDKRKHLVIAGVHPSPLSAHRGFFGQGYFSKTNTYLCAHNQTPIDWLLPSKKEVAQEFKHAEEINLSIFQS